jgi:hypothetical protein
MSPLSSRKQGEAGSEQSSVCYMLHAGFLLGLFFDPEDGSDMFLRKVGRLSTDYMTLYSRR